MAKKIHENTWAKVVGMRSSKKGPETAPRAQLSKEQMDGLK